MKYLGGKSQIGWKIAHFINKYIKLKKWNYVEPFCGACWVSKDIQASKRYCLDVNEYLIEMWKALQNGWIPPSNVSLEEYEDIKINLDRDKKLTAFVGFGCSWGGKWFGGFARGKNQIRERNYAEEAKDSLLRKIDNLRDVQFYCKNYEFVKPIRKIVYCDPPYINTTGYDATNGIDHDKFWRIMDEWSLNNIVLVSEYTCPIDTWSQLPLNTGSNEKLFINNLVDE